MSPERQSTSRYAQDAARRFTRAMHRLVHDAGPGAANEHVRALAHYDAATLLWRVLGDAELLLDALDDDALGGYEVEYAEKHARTIAKRIRDRRLAAKLEQTSGRSPEEAAAFEAKARELRGAK